MYRVQKISVTVAAFIILKGLIYILLAGVSQITVTVICETPASNPASPPSTRFPRSREKPSSQKRR